jgi:X-X-X-Leu-X-X-Gly heptad repeat protein
MTRYTFEVRAGVLVVLASIAVTACNREEVKQNMKQLEYARDEFKSGAESAAETAKAGAERIKDGAGRLKEGAEKLKDKLPEVKEQAREGLEQAKEGLGHATEKVKATLKAASDMIDETVEKAGK